MVDYNLEGLKWGDGYAGTGGGIVTWSFALTQGELFHFDYQIDDPAFQDNIRDAFDAWEAVADIDFVEVADSLNSDIRLGWAGIDGAYGEVGTANYRFYYPTGGEQFGNFAEVDIRFDTSETWSTDQDYLGNDVNFYTVALHEIGHAIGLDHFDDPNTIMYYLTGNVVDLTPSDIHGAQYIYGPAAPPQRIVGDNADNVLIGTAGNDHLVGLGGDDWLHGGSGANNLDGGAGLDIAAYDQTRSAFNVVQRGDGIAVSAYDGTIEDSTTGIERFEFSDGTLAFDVDGNAGEGYRIYQAAFDRTPDRAGVSYWVGRLDDGASLHDVAQSFIGSDEFQNLYGSNPSNTDYVDLLYQNVLDRAPDAGGYAYWTGRMDNGLSRADMLIAFSESEENQSNVSSAVDDGIWLA